MIETLLGRDKNNTESLKRATDIFYKYVGDIVIKYNPELTFREVRGKIIDERKLEEEMDKQLKIYKSHSLINGTGINRIHSKYKDYPTFKANGNLKIQEMKDMFELYNITIEEVETKENDLSITFPLHYSISCTGEKDNCLPNPKSQADIVHSFLHKDGILKKGYYYGWLNLDFANFETNYKLIDTNFIN